MKILEKRPLAIILCVMLGGFSFFADFTWQIKVILATLPLVAIAVIYIFETLKQSRKTFVLLHSSCKLFYVEHFYSVLHDFVPRRTLI